MNNKNVPLKITLLLMLIMGCNFLQTNPSLTNTPQPIIATSTSLQPTKTTAPSTPTEMPSVASGEWFVYSSTVDDNDGDDTSETDIYFARLDGSELRRLTDADGDDYEPELSPDEQKVLFVSGSKGDIYVINVDGSGLTRLTDDPATDKDPSWSPDGSKIVFVSDRDGVDQIYTMNADGSGINRLTHDEAGYRDPAWSPDGTKIAYAISQEYLSSDIYVMDANGSNQRLVVSDDNINLSPAWSPDGSKFVYASWSTENLDTSKQVHIVSTLSGEQYFFAYLGGQSGWELLESSIRVVALDGSDLRQLTENGVKSWSPSWSPDGTQIIYVAERDGKSKIFIMNADGTNKKPLTTGEGSDYSPDFADASHTQATSYPINEPTTDTSWQPVTFTIPDWNGYWDQPSENSYNAIGMDDTFIWTEEVYEGDLTLSYDIEILYGNDEWGGGAVILFGDGTGWSKGNLIFFVNGEAQNIHLDTIYDGTVFLAYNTLTLQDNHTYSLTIEILGKKASLFLDGEEIVSATLPTRVNRRGKIGLFKEWAVPEVTFSNIKVKIPGQ